MHARPCPCEDGLLPADFPDSRPAVEDLKYCLERTDQRQQLLVSLKAALETRLLHPGPVATHHSPWGPRPRLPADPGWSGLRAEKRAVAPGFGGLCPTLCRALGELTGLAWGWGAAQAPGRRWPRGGLFWGRPGMGGGGAREQLPAGHAGVLGSEVWGVAASVTLCCPGRGRHCWPPLSTVGVNTCDIITLYISAIKALRVLDPSMVILEVACEPIRRYLRCVSQAAPQPLGHGAGLLALPVQPSSLSPGGLLCPSS